MTHLRKLYPPEILCHRNILTLTTFWQIIKHTHLSEISINDSSAIFSFGQKVFWAVNHFIHSFQSFWPICMLLNSSMHRSSQIRDFFLFTLKCFNWSFKGSFFVYREGKQKNSLMHKLANRWRTVSKTLLCLLLCPDNVS